MRSDNRISIFQLKMFLRSFDQNFKLFFISFLNTHTCAEGKGHWHKTEWSIRKYLCLMTSSMITSWWIFFLYVHTHILPLSRLLICLKRDFRKGMGCNEYVPCLSFFFIVLFLTSSFSFAFYYMSMPLLAFLNSFLIFNEEKSSVHHLRWWVYLNVRFH